MVLIRCLPTDTSYIPGHVVDRGCDTLVESFVVHSPNIGQVESSYEGRQAQFSRELSGRHYVSMVLRYCLPTDAFCTMGHVVDRGCDTPIESFVIHSPFIEHVEHDCE